MRWYPKEPVGFTMILLAAAFTMAACGNAHRESSSSNPESAVRFDLAAEGLSRDGLWKSTPVFADVNGDGFVDLAAIVRLGNGAHVWMGNGAGHWTDASQGLGPPNSCGGGIDFSDINGDGFLDLAVADHCSGVYVYLGDGQGHWTLGTEELNPADDKFAIPSSPDNEISPFLFQGAEDLALGDVNEDGLTDMVVTASDEGGFAVYLGDGTGKGWELTGANGLPRVDVPEPGDENRAGWANQIQLHDMNGDRHLDVVASYYAGPRVWLGDGKGHWQSYSRGLPAPLLGGLYRGIAVGDINEDGLMDLVAANDVDGPEAYLQQPDGSWLAALSLLPSMEGGAVGVALGDLDVDGHLDLIVSGCRYKGIGSIYGVMLCAGDGKGGFTEIKDSNLPSLGLSTTWGVAIEDVNRDGLPDFAVSSGGASSIAFAGKAEHVKLPKEIVPEAGLPRMQVWINKSHPSH